MIAQHALLASTNCTRPTHGTANLHYYVGIINMKQANGVVKRALGCDLPRILLIHMKMVVGSQKMALNIGGGAKKEFGEQAKSGPCRDPAIPARGVADAEPITDDLWLDLDVPKVYDMALQEVDTFGVMCNLRRVATKEENGEDQVPPNSQDKF